MAVYDFFLSRNGAPVTQETYVGHEGRLFYDSATGEIRISDGATPGGLPIAIATATATTTGGITPGALLSVTSGGVLNVNYSGSFNAGDPGTNTLSLNQATETVLGGIKLGPGITTNAEGQLLIDSEGLEFTFGDFSGTVATYSDSTAYALLQSLNEDEDIVVATNGTGSVNIIGEFNVFATNSDVTDALENHEPIFRVLGDGQVRMLVPAADEVAGAFEITANETGAFVPPTQTGVVVHTTGNSSITNRTYLDANDNYPIIVGRRYNGTVDSPTPVLNGDVIFRLAGQAATGSSPVFQTFGPAKINWLATEDQGPSNQGGKITIDVTANGTTAFGNAITVAEFTEDGIKSTSIIPQLDETYSLGSPDKRWANVYIGQASLFLSDKTTDDPVEITVDAGTLLLNGVSNLQIGSMRITDNVLTTVNTTSDIVFGNTGDTGYVKLERDLKFSDGTVQSTAWTDEHYANTLLGTTLAENVLNSSLTSVGTLLNLTVTNTITGSVSGNAGTVTNGVYTTDTGSVTNTMLAGSIANNKLANSTISGVALGSNLAALTAGTYLTSGGTYTGGTARTFAVDATSNNTASKVVARDTNGDFAAGTITADLITETIVFDTAHVDDHTAEGTLCWSAEDGTLNLHHADGVVQQIGQELYAYVINNTGSEIADGACVRFDGADDTDGYRLEVTPFQANGVYPSLYGLGIATQTLSDGESGRICVWGKVRGINTTGGGENWQVGNILYASATTAGGLTNIKPTAPNNVVPVAAVLHVDATEGEVFVRPTIEQKMNYGRFARTTDVTAASTNTAYTVTLNTTDVSNGLSLGTPTSRIVTDQSGLFAVNVQAQCYSRFETGDETFHVWLRKNGVDVPLSMKRTSTTDDLIYNTLSYTFSISLDADDYIEVAYAFTDTGLRFEHAGATGFGPSTAAVVVDVNQVAL